MSGTSPDPREEFESSYGSRGTRGSGEGRVLKEKERRTWRGRNRKDTTVVRTLLSTLVDRRPIGTSPLWEPESAQSDSDAEITLEQIVVPESDTRSAFEGAVVSSSSLSSPVSRELRPRPSSRPSSSSSSSRILPLTPKVRAAPPPAVRRSAGLHSSLVPDRDQWDHRVSQFPL